MDAAGEGQKQTYLADNVAKIALPLCKYNFVTLETHWKIVNKGLLKDCRLPANHEQAPVIHVFEFDVIEYNP